MKPYPWIRFVIGVAVALSALAISAAAPSVRQVARAQTVPNIPPWTSIGPTGARVNALIVDPNGKVYAGTVGGVWTSTDSGNTWATNTDAAPSIDVGALAMDPNKLPTPTDPNNPWAVYAGTGTDTTGEGVLKTVDGGKTWASQNPNGIFSATRITAVAVDSRSALYVATGKGLFVSTDGGATFPTALLQNQSISALALDTNTNPTTVFVAVRGTGIEKSTDGTTFTVLAGGLPAGATFGNTALAMAPSNHQVLYTSIGAGQGPSVLAGIYKTTDGGTTWTNLPNIVDFTAYRTGGGQAFANNVLSIKPDDPNTVWGGGVNIARTTDGGTTWTNQSDFSLATALLGNDYHSFAWDTKGNLFVGSDGGLSQLTATGQVLRADRTLVARMFYPGLSQFGNATLIQGGTQDNGGVVNTGPGIDGWRFTIIGDGMGTGVNPLNPNIMYGTTFQSLSKTTDQWQAVRNNITPPQAVGGVWLKPMAVAPNPAATDVPIVYYGAGQVWTSPDGGTTWNAGNNGYAPGGGGVTAITVAPSNPQVVYAGFSDGTMEVSNDQGANWTVMTALPSSAPNCNDCVGGYITHIAVDPTNAANVAVTFGRGSVPHTQYTAPHVVQGTNATTATPTWTEVTGNLPNEAADSVVFNGASLIVGTEKSIYSGTPNGAMTNWVMTAPGLPRVPVTDLALAPNGTLTALTYGRSVWQTTLPALSPNGAGTMTVAPATVQAGGTGLTLTFTYTAATGGLTNGEVDLSIPGGWTAPTTGNVAASTGTVAVNGQTIAVTGVILPVGGTMTITYGTGGTVTAPTPLGPSTFTTRTLSAANVLPLVPLAVQPVVTTTPTGGLPPAAPTNLTLTPATAGSCPAGSGGITVNWGAPFDGGSPITKYFVTLRPIGARLPVDPPTTAITNLCGFDPTVGLTASVVATNANGNGPAAGPTGAVTPAGKAPPPTDVRVVDGNGQMDVMWKPPTTDDGGAITSYTVTAEPSGDTTTVPWYDDSAVLTGLTDGVPQTIQVTANNEYGSSAPADTAGTIDPNAAPDVPDVPTNVLAHAGNGQAFVSWTAPFDNGSPITKYTVTANPGGKTAVVTGSHTSATVTGLTNGDGYDFTVVATNAIGNSPASDPSANIPNKLDQTGMTEMGTVPGAPVGVRAVPGNGEVTVSWEAPQNDGGFEIGGYVVSATTTKAPITTKYLDVDGDTRAVNFSGLQNGTAYTFKVVALSQKGTGPASTPTSPVAPLTCTVVAGSNTPVHLGSGRWCVTGPIKGNLSIGPGASAWISNATITGSLTATGATTVQVCGSTVAGATAIGTTTGFLLVGDTMDEDCAGNTLGPLTLSSNHGGLDLWGNTIGGSVTVKGTTGSGPAMDDTAPMVGYNDITGSLSCTANTPAPLDEGNPNFVNGAKAGQCAGL